MLSVSPIDRIFILAGAGVSAESGIPTFRGVGGFWRNYRIEESGVPTCEGVSGVTIGSRRLLRQKLVDDVLGN
jgi:hypothetical protein